MTSKKSEPRPQGSGGYPAIRTKTKPPLAGARGSDKTADGQRFLMIQPLETAAGASQLQVVLNWFEELKRKVPAAK